MIYFFIILLLIITIAEANCSKTTTPITEDLHIVMLDAVNKLRTTGCQCGSTYMPPVPPLQWNDTLRLAADEHLNDMYYHGYFGHIAPDGSVPIQRAQALGYTGDYVGENIAQGFNSLDDVMQGWIKPEPLPGHDVHLVQGNGRRPSRQLLGPGIWKKGLNLFVFFRDKLKD